MKYIVFEITQGRSLAQRLPIIFPDTLVHKDVVFRLWPSLLQAGDEVSIVSAGFCDVEVKVCHGGSETLKVGSLPGDAALINSWDFNKGI